MDAKDELSLLIQLSRVDNFVAAQEIEMIYYLGELYGLSPIDIETLFDEPKSVPNINALSIDEKYDCLYKMIHLMKVDKMVFQSEIKFCDNIAIRLGYNPEVIPDLAAHIYSDSDILTNRDAVRHIADKYLETK